MSGTPEQSPPPPRSPLSAYQATLADLRPQLREAAIDHERFEQPLQTCQLHRCRATCCHDGAILSAEEAELIERLPGLHPDAFTATDARRGTAVDYSGSTPRTGTRSASRAELADDFPAHFPATRCVFLQPDHRCSLQLLSAQLGHHPWFYKPVSCWMHPVLLLPPSQGERARLTLRTPNEDPARFATCTPCGRPDSDGSPARETLTPELEFLSEVAGRDLLRELNAPPADGLREC